MGRNFRKFDLLIRWNGRITHFHDSIDYEDGESSTVPIKSIFTWQELSHICAERCCIGGRRVCKMTYQNRFPTAEVYVETEVVGQYGGGGYTEQGEGSGGFSGSGDFRVRHDAPWPTYEDRTATGPLVEHDGQEWPVWGGEWDYIRAPRQASTTASGINNDPYVDKPSPPYTSEASDVEDEELESMSSSDGEDLEVDEGEFEPPTPHYTMVPQHPLYAHNDDPDLPPIPIWTPDSGFVVGQTFAGKPQVVDALKETAMRRSFQYRVITSDTKQIHVRCENHGDGCMWHVRAAYVKRNGAWLIRKTDNNHTCRSSLISLDHRQLSARKVAQTIKHLIEAQPGITVKSVIAEVKNRHGYTISYKKAWHGKQKAMAEVYGDWEESFANMPRLILAMEDKNPGSVFVPSYEDFYGGAKRVFKRLFWAFKPCIDGFTHCLPIIQVDGTFLTGKYKGTLLVATSVDGSMQLFPLAFAIVESENNLSWAWFFSQLYTRVTQRKDIAILSDRHHGIRHAFYDLPEELGWKWRWCIRHFKSNYGKHFGRTYGQRAVWHAGKNK
ncbi:unnamed protein product [Linum tenue]|uniref:Uncharacterized protein n=1 Tax=Linum tenue TaxID=586396 RepID=A0AAV0KMC0_9ROSI|nr:unnamed protein product [Linum tenue]